jgi:Pin2-interacting protein X1
VDQTLTCSSRQKHLVSKRLASQSPAALAEILGVSVASLTASPASTPSEPSTPAPEVAGDPARTAEETTSTSTLSVADYFRQKLREKALARHAASGASAELPENSLARVKEEVKVEVGGVTWEGSRVTFGEGEDVKPDIKSEIKPDIKTEVDVKPDIKPTASELAAVTDVKLSKEERRRAKEEKRRLKEERRARKAAERGEETGEEAVVKTGVMESSRSKKDKRKREAGAEEPSAKRDKSQH